MSPVLLVAFFAGLLPALLWLGFWLLEDRRNPEPKKYIFFCFLAGMLLVFPFEYGGHVYGIILSLEQLVAQQAAMIGYASEGLLVLFFWAAIEEIFKFAAAYVAALHWRVFDEPLDGVIYMVTAALGFASVENMLFLMSPIQQGHIMETIITGDLRFIGATLLHTLSSATVGLALAYAFYKKPQARRWAAAIGVILAIALHTTFNFFILKQGSSATFLVFLLLWVGIVAVLLLIERVKRPARNYS